MQPFLTKRDLESIAKLIAENVAYNLGHGQKTSSTNLETEHLGQAPGSKASNLYELLVQEKDIQLVKVPGNSQVICCRICDEFIKSSGGSCGAFAGKVGGSLSKGLDLKKHFSLYEEGHNETWFRLKNRVLSHLYSKESKTHMEALAWWRHTRPARKREKIVVENLVRTALGIVNRNEYAQLGAASFEKCVLFVSSLPHVKKVIKDDDLELGPAFSQQVFWRMKSTLIDLIWGQHLDSLFPQFFKKISQEESKL